MSPGIGRNSLIDALGITISLRQHTRMYFLRLLCSFVTYRQTTPYSPYSFPSPTQCE